jgi:hypothetical protein
VSLRSPAESASEYGGRGTIVVSSSTAASLPRGAGADYRRTPNSAATMVTSSHEA